MMPVRPTLVSLALLAVFLSVQGLPGSAAGGETADYNRTPVLMIHGYFVLSEAGIATWTTMKKSLVEDGWPEEYIETPSFKEVRGCNADHVEEIDAWVNDMLSRHPRFSKIDIVCHSFGCLNTLSWLKDKCGVNRVRQFVGMAGAVHGTSLANLDLFSCAAREMKIGLGEDAWKQNELLARINACDETPGDVGYTSIWSEYDEIIWPQSGSEMTGARNIEVDTKWVEHGGIFLCDECYDLLNRALNEGGLNEDGPGWECIPECAPPVEPEPEASEPLPELPDAAESDPDAAESTDVIELAPDEGPPATDVVETVQADAGQARDADPGLATDPEGEAEPTPDVPAEPEPRPRAGGCMSGNADNGSLDSVAALLGLLLVLIVLQRLSRRRISRV
jgi:triacylglycerol lipase